MAILLIDYLVADFAEWKTVFDQDPMERQRHGVTSHGIYRNSDDPNRFLLRLDFSTAGEASTFQNRLAPMMEVSGGQRAWILDDPHEAEPDSDHQTYFVYKLIPPRPTFATDLIDAEADIMGRHVAYWQRLTEAGKAVAFGPVADPSGAWGLAVVEAGSEEEVRGMGVDDPAVTSEMASFEVYAMPDAIVRP
jgi:uncharacterized protein